jgi:DeoR family transcriptional regulator of aga operon
MSTAAVRQNAIRDLLAQQTFVSVATLCSRFQRSEATIRRDLEVLEREGYLRRTHGGAVAESAGELPFTVKAITMEEEKHRIARRAAALVSEGQAVGFTGGTTTQQVARELVAAHNLTVVTNALTVAMALADSDAHLIVTGGELRGPTFELVGPLAEPVATQIHLDVMFVGVDGISREGGLTTHNPMEARINHVLLERARQVVVVADHTKLGRKTFARIAPIEDADLLITDTGADHPFVDELRGIGLDVVMV